MRIVKQDILPEQIFIRSVSCSLSCNTLHAYSVGLAKVKILDCSDKLVYCVDEPPLKPEDVKIVVAVARRLAVIEERTVPTDPEGLRKLASSSGVPYLLLARKIPMLKYHIEKVLSGYGPLYPLMKDPEVEEIAVDGPGRYVSIVHRRFEVGWIDTNIKLEAEELDMLVMYLSRKIGRPLSIAHPYAEGLTPEGHRIALTFSKEVSRLGSSIVVRKHFEKPLSAIQLIDEGMASEAIMAYLWTLIDHSRSLLIAGPTASGKTTLLQALLGLIPSIKRIVTIEDTPELNLFDRPHWDSLVARHSYSRDVEDVTLEKLARFALRRRPDILVIGEIRGSEALVFLQAAATGHAALATFHADSAQSTIDRLRSMGIPSYLLEALDAIVVVKRVRFGRRIVRRVVEVVELDGGLHIIARWIPSRDIHEPIDYTKVAERSRVFRRIAEATGVSIDEVIEDYSRRVSMLRRLREQGVYEFIDVFRRIDSQMGLDPRGLYEEHVEAPSERG